MNNFLLFKCHTKNGPTQNFTKEKEKCNVTIICDINVTSIVIDNFFKVSDDRANQTIITLSPIVILKEFLFYY